MLCSSANFVRQKKQNPQIPQFARLIASNADCEPPRRPATCQNTRSGGYDRANLLTQAYPSDVAVRVQVEDENGQIVLTAEADGCRIHHAKPFPQHVSECDRVIHLCIFFLDRIL